MYNRPVLLIAMDDFTRRWYCERHGTRPDSIQPIEVRVGNGCLRPANLQQPEPLRYSGSTNQGVKGDQHGITHTVAGLHCFQLALQTGTSNPALQGCTRVQRSASIQHPGGSITIQVDFERRVQRPPDVVPPNELPIGDEADTAANASRLVRRCSL